MPAREQEGKKKSLWAKISRVLEFGLHAGIQSPMQKWHRDLVLITVTLLGSAVCLRAVTIHQHSLKKMADGVRDMPEFSPPSSNGRIFLIPRNTFPSSPNYIRPSGALLEQITAELWVFTLATALS